MIDLKNFKITCDDTVKFDPNRLQDSFTCIIKLNHIPEHMDGMTALQLRILGAKLGKHIPNCAVYNFKNNVFEYVSLDFNVEDDKIEHEH